MTSSPDTFSATTRSSRRLTCAGRSPATIEERPLKSPFDGRSSPSRSPPAPAIGDLAWKTPQTRSLAPRPRLETPQTRSLAPRPRLENPSARPCKPLRERAEPLDSLTRAATSQEGYPERGPTLNNSSQARSFSHPFLSVLREQGYVTEPSVGSFLEAPANLLLDLCRDSNFCRVPLSPSFRNQPCLVAHRV